MKLIDNARGVLHHYSTQALTLITSVGLAWHSLPDWVTSELPAWAPKVVAWGMTLVAGAGLIGKFIDQTKPAQPDTQAAAPPADPQ